MKNKEKRLSGGAQAASARSEKAKRGGLSRLFSLSILLHLVDKLTNAVYNALIKGFFGRIFTSYSYEQSAFEQGFVKNYFTGQTKSFRNIRAKLSKAFETSLIIGKLSDMLQAILSSSVKLYGNFFLSFGLYSALSYFIRALVPGLVAPNEDFILVSGISILASIPLLISRESLASAIGHGRITNLIFSDGLGFKEEDFNVHVKRHKRRANISILLGMIFGLLTFVIHPIYIVLAVLFFAITALVIVTPEIGVVISVFMIPFYSFFKTPSMVLSIFVCLTSFGYFIKLVRGKRVFKIEILDLFVIFFGVIIYMSGIITAGGQESFRAAIMSCILMLGFFLLVNLMRTDGWLDRCVSALVGSSVVVAAIGVLQYIFGYAEVAWLDTSYFSDISGRVVSLFDNPNVLAAYLVMTFPLLLAKTVKAKTSKGKLLGVLSVMIVIACTVFTWCRAAWLALIIIVAFMGLINSRKTFKALFAIALCVPALPFVLPDSIVRRFMSIGDMADSSSYYRVYTWRGTINAIKDYFVSGVGYGTAAYEEIYPQYAYAGIESAEHSHNLFLQILFGMGVFGLLIFMVVIFLFAQKNFEYFGSAKDSSVKLMASAAFVAVCGALIMGMFDYVWYSFRVFFTFWVVMAVSCAYIRYGRREEERTKTVTYYGPDSASIDI